MWQPKKPKSEYLEAASNERAMVSDRSGGSSRRNLYTSPRHMRPWRVAEPRDGSPRSYRSGNGGSSTSHRATSAPTSHRYIGLRREVQEAHGAREPRPWVRRQGPFQPAMALPASEGADSLMMWQGRVNRSRDREENRRRR